MGKGDMSIVIQSKLQRPQIRTKILRRKRLIQLFCENLEKKIILICAGAGYGKTTLVSQFIAENDIINLYYHLEKSDADPAEFFSYLIAGLTKLNPLFGRKLNKLRRYFSNSKKYLSIIAGTFVNEIIDCFNEELYIILEDYHALGNNSQIDDFISYFLDYFPSNLHFIITSRNKPFFSLARLKAKDEVLELTNHDLKFTREEIKRFLKELYAISLKLSEIKIIEEHSEGWPTSLRLMTQSSDYLDGIKSAGYVKKILDKFYHTQTGLFNYFAQEIYNSEPANIRKFLLECSVLEWLSPELCIFVTKQRNAGKMLSAIARRNSFLVKMPQYGYRFHNLFRDFLRSRLTNIEKERQILERAAMFYEQHERYEGAIKCYLQAGNYSRALNVVNKAGYILISQGKSSALCSYIEQIPVQQRRIKPGLLAVYAQTLIHTGRPDDARKNLQTAAEILKEKKTKRIKYADVLYELGGLDLNAGKFTSARTVFKKALIVCPNSTNNTRAAILNSLGLVETNIGGKYLKRATAYFDQALRITQRMKNQELEASIYNNWAMNELKAGNINEANVKLSQMVKLLKNHFSPHCGSGFFNASRLNLLLGNKDEAKRILDTGIEVCRPFNDTWSMAALWKGYSVYYQELAQWSRARKYIRKALDIYEQLGIVRLIVSALNEVCKINIAKGELNEAEKNFSAIWWFKKNKDDSEAVPLLLTNAQLMREQNRLGSAEKTLYSALSIAQRYGQVFNQFLINLELSKILYLAQKDDMLISTLRKAAKLSYRMHYDNIMLRQLSDNRWLIGIMVNNDIEKEYLFNLTTDSGIGLHWIEVALFGRPGIVFDGKVVLEKKWKTDNAKKLFFYLLIHHKQLLSSDHLVNVFWHGVPKNTGKSNLRKTIQYIRESLGLKGKIRIIESVRRSYGISDNATVIFDIDQFEKAIANALNTLKNAKKQRGYLQKALLVYKDGFANEWYEPWVEEKRDYYQRRYEDCLLMLADSYYHSNMLKKAIIWYEKLVRINIYNENYHRRLMKSYAKLGKVKDMIRDYEKLKKVLEKDLGVKPQNETSSLYRKLLR